MVTGDERLADKTYRTLILRVLVDRHGRQIQGEVVDVLTDTRRPFVGWRALLAVLRAAIFAKDSGPAGG